jgi:DDE superfamily endonuclease
VLSTMGRPSLASTFQTEILRSRAEYYSTKISEMTKNATQHCVGFIDGNLVEIVRSRFMLQRTTYNGHKRRTGLKWKVITTPDGMMLHIFGPYEGRRIDMHLYAESGLYNILDATLLIYGVQHYIFGDSGSMLRPYLMSPHEGANLGANELLFNKRLSKAIVSVQ